MKKALANFSLLILSCAIFLGLIEVGFRLVPEPKGKATEDIGGSTGPNWDDRPKFYFDPEVSADHRGQIHDPIKKAEAFRIAVVGDSYSFAPYMQIDDSFPSKLGRMLNQNNSTATAEVVNYGISGYSTSHEIAAVQRAIREQADLIVLQITLNDAELKPYRPNGTIIATNRFGAYVEIPEESWINSSKFATFIKSRLHVLQSQQKYIDYFNSLYADPKGYQNFKESLAQIAQLSSAAKIPIVAVTFPLFGTEVDDEYPFDEIHGKIKSALDELLIRSIDLKSSYKNIPILRLQVIPGVDFHPNEIAHRIAAEEIYSFLVKESLVPEQLVIKKTYPVRNKL